MTDSLTADSDLVQLLLIEREAVLGEWRQKEDWLLAMGAIGERRIVSSRLMKRLYEAFGEEEVKGILNGELGGAGGTKATD